MTSKPTVTPVPTPSPTSIDNFNNKWTLEGTFNCPVTNKCPSANAVTNALWRVLEANLTSYEDIKTDDYACNLVVTFELGVLIYNAHSYFEIEMTRSPRYPSYGKFEHEIQMELESALGSRLWIAGCNTKYNVNDLFLQEARRYPTLLPTTSRPTHIPTRIPTGSPSSTPAPSPLPTVCEDASWFCKDLIGPNKPGKDVDDPEGFCTKYFCDGHFLGVKGEPCTHAGFCDLSW